MRGCVRTLPVPRRIRRRYLFGRLTVARDTAFRSTTDTTAEPDVKKKFYFNG